MGNFYLPPHLYYYLYLLLRLGPIADARKIPKHPFSEWNLCPADRWTLDDVMSPNIDVNNLFRTSIQPVQLVNGRTMWPSFTDFNQVHSSPE